MMTYTKLYVTEKGGGGRVGGGLLCGLMYISMLPDVGLTGKSLISLKSIVQTLVPGPRIQLYKQPMACEHFMYL